MNITSINFLLFALIAFGFYSVATWLRWPLLRDLVLLVANLYFLASFNNGSLTAFLPMLIFIAIGYFGILILHRQKNSVGLTLFLVVTMGYFFWIKKYSFVPDSLLLSHPYVTIGLSYMFFRILQLQIDASSGNLEKFPNIVTYLNYLLNFSTLISGPIQRYESFAENREVPARLNWVSFGIAMERITIGAFKVMVLATIFFSWHKETLTSLPATEALPDRTLAAAAIVVSYTFYLYCNFSGYTDMMIGVARFFRNELPENFDRPFAALNFMDFWARWHMTLSNWLKTYVYNPLAASLMARFPSKEADPYIGVAAFLVTFFLIGLWHGQTAVFALYGLVLGVGVSGNKLYQVLMIKKLGRKQYRNIAAHWLYQAIARGLTFTYFCISLIFFWASEPQIEVLSGKLGWDGATLTVILVLVAATVLLDAWERVRQLALKLNISGQVVLLSRYLRTVWVTGAVLVTVAVASLASTPAPDIIYKNF